MDKIKNHNKVIIVFFSLSLIVLLIGFSYAFFRYKKTGLYTQSIEGAKMKIIYDEITGNSIALNNAYPMTDEEAVEDALEFEFTVTGYNEMIKNIFYAVEIEHGMLFHFDPHKAIHRGFLLLGKGQPVIEHHIVVIAPVIATTKPAPALT